MSTIKPEELLVHWVRWHDGTWTIKDCKPKSELTHEQQRLYRKSMQEFKQDQEQQIMDGKIDRYPCALDDLKPDPILGAPHPYRRKDKWINMMQLTQQ